MSCTAQGHEASGGLECHVAMAILLVAPQGDSGANDLQRDYQDILLEAHTTTTA